MTQEYKLRDYQQEAVDEIDAGFSFGEDEIILEACTSFGKTSVICELARVHKKSVTILVSLTPLVQQISNTLTLMGVDHSIIKAGRDSEFDPNARVHLAMAQTLHSRIKADKMEFTTNLLIQDEYHISYNTKRTDEIKQVLKPNKILGLTATPYDARGYRLSNTAEIVATAHEKDLESQGFLAPVKYYIPEWSEKVDYDRVKKNGGDYTGTALNEIVNTETHIEQVIQSMNKLNAQNKKTIVFCSTIEQCDYITNRLKQHGYLAESFHSKIGKQNSELMLDVFTNNADNYIETGPKKKLSELESGSLFDDKPVKPQPRAVKCLVSVSRLTTGFSVEDIQLGVAVSKTLVRSKFVQMAGRLRRIHPDKQFGEFLDCAQLISTHGFPDEIYVPPPRIGISLADKKALADATKSIPDIRIVCDDELSEPITLDKYNLRLVELKNTKKRLTQMDVPELRDKLLVESDLLTTFSIITVLFDKVLCEPMPDKWGNDSRGYVASNGKTVVGFVNPRTIEWIASKWMEAYETLPQYFKDKYLRALKTRSINAIKQNKSIYSLGFFIEFLMEQDSFDLEIEDSTTKEEPNIYDNDHTDNADDYEIDEDGDIPF
jgi:superfamily II DNA or RNA helicase